MPNKRTKYTDEEINQMFSDFIREKMTENKFWRWVSTWKDEDEICNEAENWEKEEKAETLKYFRII